jgi:hypothetical protein
MPEQGVGYDQALSIFNEQAAKTPMTNPLQEFVVNICLLMKSKI